MHIFSSINVNKEILQRVQLCASRPQIEFIFHSSPTTSGSHFCWGRAQRGYSAVENICHFSIYWGSQKEVLLDYGIKDPFNITNVLAHYFFLSYPLKFPTGGIVLS